MAPCACRLSAASACAGCGPAPDAAPDRRRRGGLPARRPDGARLLLRRLLRRAEADRGDRRLGAGARAGRAGPGSAAAGPGGPGRAGRARAPDGLERAVGDVGAAGRAGARRTSCGSCSTPASCCSPSACCGSPRALRARRAGAGGRHHRGHRLRARRPAAAGDRRARALAQRRRAARAADHLLERGGRAGGDGPRAVRAPGRRPLAPRVDPRGRRRRRRAARRRRLPLLLARGDRGRASSGWSCSSPPPRRGPSCGRPPSRWWLAVAAAAVSAMFPAVASLEGGAPDARRRDRASRSWSRSPPPRRSRPPAPAPRRTTRCAWSRRLGRVGALVLAAGGDRARHRRPRRAAERRPARRAAPDARPADDGDLLSLRVLAGRRCARSVASR